MNRETRRKWILQAGIFFVMLSAAVWIVFRNQNRKEMLDAVRSMSGAAVALSVLFAAGYVAQEGCMIWYLLRKIGEFPGLGKCICYSFLGFFFSGITPSATGGQPAQLYYMKKDQISYAHGSVVLMIVAVIYKLVLALIGTAILIFAHNLLAESLQMRYQILYLIGLLLNVGLVLGLGMLMFSPGIVQRFLEGADRLLQKFRKKKKQSDWASFMEGYREAVYFFREHKSVVAVMMLGTFLQRFFQVILTYTVYRGLGLSGTGMGKILILQAVVSIAVEMIPVPGAQGVTELMYQSAFGNIFPGQYLTASVCVIRGIGFYVPLLIGLGSWAFLHGKQRKV